MKGAGLVSQRAGNPSPGTVFRFRFLGMAGAWGSSFLFMKIAWTGLSPGQIVLGRLRLGAAALVIVQLAVLRHLGNPVLWLVAVALGALVLHERLSWNQLAGGTVVMLSLLLNGPRLTCRSDLTSCPSLTD